MHTYDAFKKSIAGIGVRDLEVTMWDPILRSPDGGEDVQKEAGIKVINF